MGHSELPWQRSALAILVLVVVVTAACSGPETTEDRLRDCPQVSWDGNRDSFEEQIRDRLNDPGSMETFGTYFRNDYALEADGRLRVRMEWGARNAFGGMVRTESAGLLNLDTCHVQIAAWGF